MLKLKEKISRRAAQEMILLFARHGNHYHETNFKSDADVKRAFAANRVDFEKLVEECRDFTKPVPFFENMISSTWLSIGDVEMSRVDAVTGDEDLKAKGPGALVLQGYWATFESALEARDRSIQKSSYTEYLSAITSGIASIEGYVNYRAEQWNKKHDDQLLIDSSTTKVSLTDKFDNWIPVMTQGKKLDKSGVNWRDFKIIKSIRDDLAIHPKSSGYGISFYNLAEKINLFRTGIAGLLIQLHLLFNEKIPGVIIRATYVPDVEVK